MKVVWEPIEGGTRSGSSLGTGEVVGLRVALLLMGQFPAGRHEQVRADLGKAVPGESSGSGRKRFSGKGAAHGGQEGSDAKKPDAHTSETVPETAPPGQARRRAGASQISRPSECHENSLTDPIPGSRDARARDIPGNHTRWTGANSIFSGGHP